MLSDHLILCCPLLLLPSIFPSIRVFSNESALHIRWPKYWSFSISPSNEYSELISFRMDWLDLLAVQRTLKSLLQHHSLKASILWLSAFFLVQLSHLYITTGKTMALSIWTFVGKVMSLLFNMLSRCVTVFLPRSRHLLILWLQSVHSDAGATWPSLTRHTEAEDSRIGFPYRKSPQMLVKMKHLLDTGAGWISNPIPLDVRPLVVEEI